MNVTTTAAGPPVVADEVVPARIPALDGIRALAITMVLVFHGGFGWAGGGFFGVDVFFTLSGFLITGLLVAEFGQRSNIGLKRFWGRRVRRLVPALLALLAAVAVYGVFFAPPDTLGQLRGDAVSTLLYGNNWHLISGGTGYFADLNTPRPLLHTWSLSIEEQFYILWPLAVLGILRITRSRWVLFIVAVGGAVASAVAMAVLFHGGAGQSRVYYGTDTRAQALLIGAALAILLGPTLSRPAPPADTGGFQLVRPRPTTPLLRGSLVVLGGVGLAVLAWMSATTDSTTQWIYQGGFALVAMATAAVVACVALVPASPWTRALSLRPVRYVGAISYGLYLWHWPVFVLVDNARTGLVGWPLFALRAGVSLSVAALSFHLLEMPIRRRTLGGWRGWVAAPVAVGGTAILVFATTAGAAPGLAARNVSNPVPPPPATSAGSSFGETAGVPAATVGSSGPVRALLVGDSEASFLGFGLGPESTQFGVDYAGDGVFGCGLLHGDTRFHGTVVESSEGWRGGHQPVSCLTQLVRWRADLTAFRPDVVLLSEGEYEVRDQLMGDNWSHIGDPKFDRAELDALDRATVALRSTGATVVLLTAVYYHQPEQANGEAWPEDDPHRVNLFNAILRRVAAGSGGKVVVEDLNAHLDPGGHYVQFIKGVNVRYADGIHVDVAGADLAAPWLLSQVVQLGAVERGPVTAAATPPTVTPAAS